jgi:hypothetical protein
MTTTTQRDWDKIWEHFNRMQKRVMSDMTTKEEFFAQPEYERMEFYEWMQRQCGQYACWLHNTIAQGIGYVTIGIQQKMKEKRLFLF